VTHTDGVPHLELVDPELVLFHEHPERRRTLRLMDRLREEARLRNPPVVAKARGDRFVLLDGANRVSALKELGFSHIPVQVVDYGNARVRLEGWHHLLLEGRALELRHEYERFEGVRLEEVTPDELPDVLGLRRAFAVLVDSGSKHFALFPKSGRVELVEWMRVVDRVVAAYEGKSPLERIKIADYANPPDVFRAVEHQLVLVPTISKVELLALVESGVMIPTGLTRHLIPGRALGLNLELAFLRELTSADEKVRHFRRFLDDLEMRGRIRFYEESLFIMNE
jgi:hypothetical protein